MDPSYSHYCRKDRLYFACTHPDPEKTKATCPNCGGRLTLNFSSLEDLKTQIGLSADEMGQGQVKYQKE